MKPVLHLVLVLVLSACAASEPFVDDESAEPGLTRADRLAVSFTQTDVTVAPLVNDAIGRAVTNEAIVAAVSAAAQDDMRWLMGDREARVQLEITRLNIVSAGQAVLLGGTSSMEGTAALVDAATGARIGTPVIVRVAGTGAGYAPGGMLGALALGERQSELDYLATTFVRRARLTLLGG